MVTFNFYIIFEPNITILVSFERQFNPKFNPLSKILKYMFTFVLKTHKIGTKLILE